FQFGDGSFAVAEEEAVVAVEVMVEEVVMILVTEVEAVVYKVPCSWFL
ncbi:hypothetical protein ISN45_Aa05g024780, partial [Arabidopsis thaliana x Arabidopsis arenosa]